MEKVRRLEKGTPPPVVTVVTIITYAGGFRDKKCVNFEAVLHTMNIEGQIHQKNPGMGQTPPPLRTKTV